MPRPREHNEETRRRLLDVAGTLLAEQGVGALSVRRLADEVGTTTRAIYSLFGGKDGLLRAMYREGFETLDQRTGAVPVTGDPLEDIAELARAYRASAVENRNLYALMFDRVPGWQPLPEDLGFARSTLRHLQGAAGRAVVAGQLPPDERARTLELWALVHGLASLELSGALGRADAATRSWEQAVAAALRGYRRSSPAAGPA